MKSDLSTVFNKRTKGTSEFLTINLRATDAARNSLTRYWVHPGKSPVEGTVRLAILIKYKWIAGLVGGLLAGLPVLFFTSWLYNQSEPEVLIEAKSSIRAADLIIDEAVNSFGELDARSVRSCQLSDVQILRQMAFASAAIKELAVVDRNGQTLCTDRGNVFVPHDVIAVAPTSNPEVVLEVVRTVESDERLLRVRRLASRGKLGLAALLRVSQILPRVTPNGHPFSGYARMTLADGTLVGTEGQSPTESDQQSDPIVARAISKRYGPIVTVTMVRHGVIANHDDLRRIATVFIGMIAIAILICALFVMRWQSKDPISIIQNALIADELVPYYQPIVDINSGKLLGAEILIRWRKADGSVIEPTAFIGLIEASNVVRDVTRFLMRKVCAEVGTTLAIRRQMYIAFNIAPRHICDPAIINDVGSIVDASLVDFRQIVLELTERSELEDSDAAHRVIVALQGLGIRVALDDFGTGRNGLSHIQKLGVDIIKIDKSFVDTITTARQAQAITTTLVGLARALELQIIAEGVETFDQVTYLREYGVNAAQGYIFAPPLPGSAFLELVKALDPQPLEAVADTLGEVSQSVDRVA